MAQFAVIESKEQFTPDPFSTPWFLTQGQVGNLSEHEEALLVQSHYPSFSITSLRWRDRVQNLERPLLESDVDVVVALSLQLAWHLTNSAVTWRRWWATSRISGTQPSISKTLVPPTQLAFLERQYTLRERGEVLQFLEKHPYLVELLLEAYGKIEAYFLRSEVFLEVAHDPEASDGDELVASIATTLKPKEAMQSLNQFDDDWWLSASDASEGRLCIRLEFK